MITSIKVGRQLEIVMVSNFDKVESYNFKKHIKHKRFKTSQLKNI